MERSHASFRSAEDFLGALAAWDVIEPALNKRRAFERPRSMIMKDLRLINDYSPVLYMP